MRSRRLSFVTRVFIALFVLSAVPSVVLLSLATLGLRNYVELTGAGGAWQGISETGRDLLTAVQDSAPDSLIQAAAAEHQRELSRSVGLARRWDLIAGRLANALPWVALVLGLSLGMVAALIARQLARGLSRPVGEVVDWAGRLSREQPLPAPGAAEDREAPEFSVLRTAFREMAQRLEEGRRQALETERLKGLTEMARRVAHEIKNPLTPLLLAARQARRSAVQASSDALQEPLDVIEHEAERLDEMARSFAQLGRLPEGPTSRIDLGELLRDLLNSDVPTTIAARLVIPAPVPEVEGHLTALSRAFRNLLGNAVEALADQPGGRIDVTLTCEDGWAQVTIADNGPGVPPEHIERLWNPDFSTKKRGTGLGLAIVRQTVTADGGSVELSASDTGACFTVRLPLAEPPAT